MLYKRLRHVSLSQELQRIEQMSVLATASETMRRERLSVL